MVGVRSRLLRPEMRSGIPAVTLPNADGLTLLSWIYLDSFFSSLSNWTLRSAETFTCDFYCITTEKGAYKSTLRWQKTNPWHQSLKAKYTFSLCDRLIALILYTCRYIHHQTNLWKIRFKRWSCFWDIAKNPKWICPHMKNYNYYYYYFISLH